MKKNEGKREIMYKGKKIIIEVDENLAAEEMA